MGGSCAARVSGKNMNNSILAPHTLLQNRYLIERLIAQGGMGAVYQAIDQRLGSTVALKQILVTDTDMRKAFEREARLLASLRHTALPVVSDHFTEDAGQFLVMQFIPGDDLGAVLDRKKDTFTGLSALSMVLSWADRLLDALDYLHTHRPPIIHRDIKPQNLKLTPRGEIVLLDFGLAKGSINKSLSSTTARSVRAYTTQYAPLEQIQGTGTEPRSDLYALASTLYHMLTGEPPPNALSRASAVLTGKPDPLCPIHKLNANIPPAIAAIIHQAMAHGIAKRFASAAAMRTALRMVQQTGALDSAGQKTIVVPAVNVSATAAEQTPEAVPAKPEIAEALAAPTLIVAQQGQGNYTTISEAVAHAQPGSRILVRPGVYREGFVLDKPLDISGDGARAEIIVEGVGVACVQMKTDYATVRGLTLRGRAGTQGAAQAAIDIPQGRLSLENCVITTEGRMCVVIRGKTAHPVLWHCQIHRSKGIGVLIYEQGRGTLEECDISDHVQAGIAIRHGGTPTIRRCKIHNNTNDGIYVDEKGLGTVEECEIWENGRAGVEIKQGGTPFIRRCKIHSQSQGYGIYICDKGEGYIEECEVSGNGRAGIAIIQGGNPLVRRCRIHHEQQRGLLFSSSSQGTIEQCTIVANGRLGVEIRKGSQPILRQCKINHHSMVGILVHQQGGGQVEGCDLTGNTRGAWHIESGSKILRRGNKE